MTLPQNEPYSKGVSAGLRSSLMALLIFFWLDCGIVASIFLGALMGVAMGRIVYWWEWKDEVKPEQPIFDESLEDVAIERRRQKKYYARHRRSRSRQTWTTPGMERFTFWKRQN